MASFTTLNPTDKALLTLSGLNLTFAGTGGSGGARAITPQTTGKFYFEVVWTTAAGNDTGCGLAKSTATFAALQSNAANGVINFHGFNIFNNGSNTGINPGRVNAGTTIGVAVDLGGSLVWFTTDGTHWNSTTVANLPSGGTGGISISGITGGNLYPVVLAQNAGDGGTCNFGDSAFVYSVPSGFAGWPVPPPVAQIANRGTKPIFLRIGPSYADEQLSQEWSNAQRLRNFHVNWKINAKQIDVSKALDYDVLAPPDAADVSKFLDYDVLAPPDALDVSKVIDYAVLEFSPVPQLPARGHPILRQIYEWELIDSQKRERPIIGTFSLNASPLITGLAAAAQAGVVIPDVGAITSGQQATAQLGSLIPNVEPNITGQEADTAIGTLGFSQTAVILGQHAAALIGSILSQTGPNAGQSTIAGQQVSAVVGSFTFTQTMQLGSVQATVEIGTVTVNLSTGGLMMTGLESVTIPGFGPLAFVSMRYSDTKGASWRFPVRQPLGNPGAYNTNVQFRQNGIARDRIYDVSWGTAQGTALTGLMVELEESAT